jgi:hypothetical protein
MKDKYDSILRVQVGEMRRDLEVFLFINCYSMNCLVWVSEKGKNSSLNFLEGILEATA